MPFRDLLRPGFLRLPRAVRVLLVVGPVIAGVIVLLGYRSIGANDYLQDRLLAWGIALLIMPVIFAFPVEEKPGDSPLGRTLRITMRILLVIFITLGVLLAVALIIPLESLL